LSSASEYYGHLPEPDENGTWEGKLKLHTTADGSPREMMTNANVLVKHANVLITSGPDLIVQV
jgi:hypothetical protein